MSWETPRAKPVETERRFTGTLRLCQTCSTPIVGMGRDATRHGLCDPSTLAGKVCICPPRCTDKVWGDGGNCSAKCEVCNLMRGQSYAMREGKART